ncbi:MAG: DNA polymerase III subunit beta [Bacteroidales bacterium]|jgi:DNA polymerase-3 subunit beta|nr:DNA polymerase III subunit beta [Bacteroidales bacterium]
MKFIVSRDVLFKNLTALSGVIGNSTLAILDNFLFTIENDKLKITASDLETTMNAVIELTDVEGEGSVAVPSKILLETLKLLPETPLVFSFDMENTLLKFESANGTYDSPFFPGDEYPQVKDAEDPNSFEIDAQVLQRAISKTIFATGSDDLRANMMGVLCELSSEYITFVATDAHKLVRFRSTSVKTDDFVSFILPKKPLNQLKTILTTVVEPVKVFYAAENHHIKFTFENIELYSRLKEGKFPNYEAVIPTDNENKLLVQRNDFLKSIRRVGNFSSQSTYQIRVSINEEIINIKAEDIDYSNKADETLTGNYTGEPIEIGFNAKFLREMLENMDSEVVSIDMSTPSRAALVLPAEEYTDDENLLMLIMPVMLSNA